MRIFLSCIKTSGYRFLLPAASPVGIRAALGLFLKFPIKAAGFLSGLQKATESALSSRLLFGVDRLYNIPIPIKTAGMRLIVYVDVLVVLNFIVNYLLLAVSVRLGGGGCSRLRLALAALIGAGASLALFLPPLPTAVNVALKTGLSALLAVVAGGYRDGRGYLRQLFLLLVSSFILAGLLLCVTLLGARPSGLYYNGVVYFPISSMQLLLGAAAAYLAMALWKRFSRRGMAVQEQYLVSLSVGGRTVELVGEMDSQNRLIDFFSGTPVVVGPRTLLEPILPQGMRYALQEDYSAGQWMAGIRMIPCRTVAGEELLPAFRPDRMVLESGKETIEVEDVYIAVASQLDKARDKKLLLNPALAGRKSRSLL